MTRFILIPLLLCLSWALFLNLNGLTLAQGKKGFYWIIGICAIIALFFSVVIYITHSQ